MVNEGSCFGCNEPESARTCAHDRCCCLCEYHGEADEPVECGQCNCCVVDESDESQRAWADEHLNGNAHFGVDCPACVAANLILDGNNIDPPKLQQP